jgi:hypothetical protein
MNKPPPRRRRFIPPKVEITLKEIEALPKRSRGPKRNPASKLKYALKKFIGKSNNKRVTPNTKRVADVLIDWYRPGRRHSWASRETLANELAIAQSTVSAAVAVLHDLGLIYTKTGGFGAKANEFVPNFRLVLNPDTGNIIKNDNFKKSRVSADSTDSTTPLESTESVESPACSEGETVSDSGCNPQTSPESVSDSGDSTGLNPVSDNRTQEKGCTSQSERPRPSWYSG